MPVVVRYDLGGGRAGVDLLAVDDAWYLDDLVRLAVYLGLKLVPLGASGSVA
jgi:hypothetical protein